MKPFYEKTEKKYLGILFMKIGKFIGHFLENRPISDLKVKFSENRVDFKSPANDPKCKSKVQKGPQSA